MKEQLYRNLNAVPITATLQEFVLNVVFVALRLILQLPSSLSSSLSSSSPEMTRVSEHLKIHQQSVRLIINLEVHDGTSTEAEINSSMVFHAVLTAVTKMAALGR